MSEKVSSCIMCNAIPAKLVDKTCGSTHYCSKECQEEDWPRHKLLCKQFKNMNPQPTSMHRRAILFRENETRPELVWVECHLMPGNYESADMDPFFGPESPAIGYITENRCRNRDLSNVIVMRFCDEFLYDGSKLNQAIYRATNVLQGTLLHWRGPMLIMQGGRSIDSNHYGDITLEDYSNALDFFVDYSHSRERNRV